MLKKSNEKAPNEGEIAGAADDAAKAEGGQMAAGDAADPNGQSNTLPPPDAIASAGTVADMVSGVADAQSGFDPLIHAVNPDGTPKRKVDGSYALKRGRKMGAAAPTSAAPGQPAEPAPAPGDAPAVKINADEAARQTCNVMINGAVMMFGEQWAPRDKDEAKGLQTSFKNYFEARGTPNVPPEVGLVFAVLAYSLPRLTHEKTVSRFSQIKIRAYEIWSAMRGRK